MEPEAKISQPEEGDNKPKTSEKSTISSLLFKSLETIVLAEITNTQDHREATESNSTVAQSPTKDTSPVDADSDDGGISIRSTNPGPSTRDENAPAPMASQESSFENEAAMSSGGETTLTELSLSTGDLKREADDEQVEPFPDYYESCENNVQLMDKEHEAAYNYAISKVAEEVIRFRDIDSRVASFPDFPPQTADPALSETPQTLTVKKEAVLQPEMGEKSPGADATETATTRGSQNQTPSPDIEEEIDSPSWLYNSIRASHLHVLLDEVRFLLANPRLKLPIRRRFTAMTNMVIRMNYIIFQQETRVPIRFFLAEEKDLSEIKILATEIIKYLAIIDLQLQEQVDVAVRVRYILSEIEKDNDISAYTRYQRMAQVVMIHLKKPRPLERRLLSVFLELYDEYVYTGFLRTSNRQLVLEDEEVNVDRSEVSRLLIALWDILNRVIENYELYVKSMKEMKAQFFAPALDTLQNSPEIWEESWDKHQVMIQMADRERDAEEQPEEEK
ncbi:hypothetical protein ASPZODRAFT_166327 [Penicilliopsis zonata CBS 506.65]|uniref:Uncharacterized protein n=1 Tax=Penicilliopsis zonata CBS 506.65 TaxID=1073090 RepID=A0A1L9SIQ7_9EURO|nr:hypothetical protein ASPZODRAFT_166327 [Penicilliopsis zonata CBS 506.65]OJJ47078.1 hypothetical protein ASPZODRAFT_166327 [Penicilliopsis zonata CBS 506.65]